MSNKEVYKELFNEHTARNDDENMKRLYDWKLLPCKKDAKILDVGCGDGKYTVLFEKHSKNVTGIDVLNTAEKVIKHFEQMDALSIMFPQNTFDIVFCSGVAHHTPNPYGVIAECWRVCKPGGKIYIAVYKDNWYYKMIKFLRRMKIAKLIPLRIAKKLSFDVDNLYADYVHKFKRENLETYYSAYSLKIINYQEGYKMHRHTLVKQ